ncbi:MAG: methyl-accepting chemotaxis protein [Pseudomonadota bacterium]
MKAPSINGVSGTGNKVYSILAALLLLFIALGVVSVLYIYNQSNFDKQYRAVVSEQLLLSQRLYTQAYEASSGKREALTELKLLRDRYEYLASSLVRGDNSKAGLLQLPASLQQDLNKVHLGWEEYRKNIDVILNARRSLSAVKGAVEGATETIPNKPTEVQQALRQMDGLRKQLLQDGTQLVKGMGVYGDRLNLFSIAAFVMGGLSLIILLALGYLMSRAAKKKLEMTDETNRRNQQAILRLLDEMTNLAEGDLTVHATVTEDITGAIADSVNYSIDALRSLVTTINHTGVRLSSAAETTQGTAQRLAGASSHQAKEITVATAAITEMAESIEKVSKNSLTSSKVAQTSVRIAHKGAQAVSRTIDGMGTIREQIQETSKRIKRLGESSQEIGDIVSLINEIADQTSILALNAAIQASTAGEAGRGFAVVADEVQRLAERAGNATKQIETLVKTIQSDTNEAVTSMEHSTANVVAGAKLAENAGGALTEIETVSNRLALLINSISQAAKQQSTAAANITNTMNVIQEITIQTSEGTAETASSVANLTGLASELRHSVAGFKLPKGQQA